MTFEQGVWIVLSISLFIALWGPHVIWRAAGLKLAIDSVAVALLGFGGGAPTGGLRATAIVVLCLGPVFLFLFAVFAFQHFKARPNE